LSGKEKRLIKYWFTLQNGMATPRVTSQEIQNTLILPDITVFATGKVIKYGFSLQNKCVLPDELDSILPQM
jgi:hypothetical protein